jgi:hypothetical protein
MNSTSLYKYLLSIVLVLNFQFGNCQSKEIASINNYIKFSNECVHGMLIVHRLLENFNQEVNKFVNLESHQVNFYSNKDLPKNIFEDPDSWFYEISPKKLFEICQKQTNNLQTKDLASLNRFAIEMNGLIDRINLIRFQAESLILEKDMTIRDNQEMIYEVLENGVKLFDDFYDKYSGLQLQINQILEKNPSWNKYPEIRKVHSLTQEMLKDLRTKEDNDWEGKLLMLQQKIDAAKVVGIIDDKILKINNAAVQFIKTADVPDEYKLYGKYYYYHNSKLLNLINRYGNGYVNNTNNLISNKGLLLMEIPHFYQVIYPSRWMEDIPLMSTDPMINIIPRELKNREIVVSDRVIIVDKKVVTLELYDHKMIDGDIVSVNFNGDWILENYKLKGKPFKIDIQLNDDGKNYLLLHAVNLGDRPPNTMALKYIYKGKEELVILSSNLDESELIEIQIDP